ncbi:MAG: restriction endonuclease subunit S, partial [Candidatus Altiarchaeota archaeon]|nr:restriction endonuclease subunit S [Candidatus Altiarchaeota archaeon]
MKHKPYPKYKDSGIEWIGEVPEGWSIRRIDKLSIIRRGASPRPIDDQKYFDEKGEYAWVRIADVTASDRYLTETTEKLSVLGKSLSVPLEPGRLFISIAGTVGKPIITKIKCCIHDGFVYFRNLKLFNEYLYYIFIGGQAYLGLGKLGTQLNLNTETIGLIQIPVPTEPEQNQIASFLDRKTSEIDQTIEKDKQLIELLKEKRAALINHAVTKGLDPGAKMKDSGIEWVGEVPEGWEVWKLSHLARIYSGGTPDKAKEYYWENGDIPWISSGEVNQGDIINPTTHITKEAFHNSSAKWIPKDSLIMALAGQGKTKGTTAYLKIETTGNQSLAAIIPNK